MPQTDTFDRVLFKEATEKCAFFGIEFSEAEFIAEPDKYCAFIDRYNAELKAFLEENNQRIIDIQKELLKDTSLPKYIALGRARLTIEKEFQQSLMDKYAKPTDKSEVIKNIRENIENYRQEKNKEKMEQTKSEKENIRKKQSKRNFWDKITSTVKVLAVSVPFLGFGYMTYFGLKNPGRIDNSSNNKSNIEVVHSPKKKTNRIKPAEKIAQLSPIVKNKHKVHSDVRLPKHKGKYNMEVVDLILPTHTYTNIDANIPVLENDPLLQLPNIDLFNYCFSMSNDYLGRFTQYGVGRDLYNDYMTNNMPKARMCKTPGYNSLSYTDLRVIAKSEIFDKYGIGYMQNSSIASYLYNILVKHYSGKNYVGAVAQGVKDFYAHENKEISTDQAASIECLISNQKINMSDWRQLVALINKTSVSPSSESRLFSFIKNRVRNSGLEPSKIIDMDNQRFAYEPTLKDVNINNSINKSSFLPNVNVQNYNKIDDIYKQQKDRDIEVFFKIYEQCSHENYVNLKYGNNKKYSFSEANRALREFNIQGSIHPSFYCAGMSIASFCQAAKIFKEENPDSYVNAAIDDFINSCQNIHSCITLKNDMSMINSSVHHSYNIEADVKNYMKANDDAILFVWAPRGYNKYHHQTVFPSARTNNSDTYTYCAFNNQHWGNENTFARYMRSRSQYGRGGFFADVKSTLDYLTQRNIDKAMHKAKLSFADTPFYNYCFNDSSIS